MTEYFDNTPELEPPPQASMMLMKCGRLAGFDGREGWPDALSIDELAALQFPDDKELQGDLIALLTPAVHRGELDAVTVMREPKAWAWNLADPKPIPKFPEPGLKRKAAVRAIREIAKIDPSECVCAWLGPAWQKVGAGDTAPIEKRKKSALVSECQSDWPTIKRDIQDASRNGLAAAAKLADGRDWDKGRALEWAKERGKLIEKGAATWAFPPAILPQKGKRGRK